MNWVREIFARMRAMFGKRQRDAMLDEELQTHLAMLIEQNVERGMSAEEARRAAKMSLGGEEQIKESVREHRGLLLLETLWQDVRYGMRMLRKSPAFTVVAVLTLALGIGANTAIFSAVNGILLSPLPYEDSSRLVTVQREQIAYYLSRAQLREIQQQCTAIESMARYTYGSALLTGGAVPEQVSTYVVSSDFFPLLGVKPLLGRPILPEDTQPGHALVAVFSYRLWMDEFGGDPGIVGRTISVDHKPYVVIGVMPKEFGLGVDWTYRDLVYGSNYDGMWVPLVASSQDPQTQLPPLIIARLKQGATLAETNAQLRVLSARFAAAYPAGTEGLDLRARSLNLGIDGRVRTGLLILLGTVGFVLLMACVNVTSLLVARAWTRQKELTIRKALGATQLRLVRQLLSESLLLAMAGGAFGLFLSFWGIRVLRVIAPPYTPRVDYIRIDGNVLWFTMGISILAAVLVGLVPALHASSRRMGGTLKGGLSGSFAGVATRRSHRLRSALVILEVALAIIVVAGGALMARSFYKLLHLDTGVRADHVLTMSINLSDLACGSKSGADAKQLAHKQPSQRKPVRPTKSGADRDAEMRCATLAADSVLDGVRSIAGVQTAALSQGTVFQAGGVGTPGFHYPGGPQDLGLYVEGLGRKQLAWAGVASHPVTPGFFAATGIRLVKGRDFEPRDLNGPPVAIVSQSFAREYIPADPLGKRFSVSEDENGNRQWVEIVGVANDVRDRAVKDDFGPVYYTPFLSFWFASEQCEVIVRTSTDPMAMVPAIERVVRSVDNDASITKIETADQIIANSAAEPRFQTALLGSFGALGLLLAIIGTYGVISYSVVQRTHEIGVRIALGAQPRNVLRMVLGEGLLLASIGIAIGVTGGLMLTRFLRSLLFEIKPTDPLTFFGVAIFLIIVSLAACYIPARRAMKVDPMVALRYE